MTFDVMDNTRRRLRGTAGSWFSGNYLPEKQSDPQRDTLA
jgi:hypothetical protein